MSSKKRFSKKSSWTMSRIIFVLLLVLLGLPALGFGYVLATFDINAYRLQIEQAVRENTGREIQLAGEIQWTLSLDHGFSLSVSDVIVKNPSWASRPDMAKVGEAKLHLDVMPLLQKKLNIIAFELARTNVQLETASNGATNWDFAPKNKSDAAKATTAQAPSPSTKSDIAINVREVRITESRFGMRGRDGKISIYEVPELTLTSDGKGIRLKYEGKIADVKTELNLAGGPLDQVMGANWPFALTGVYDKYDIEAKGTLNDSIKKIALTEFSLSSGETKLSGDMVVLLNKDRPDIRGKIRSTKLNLDDLKPTAKEPAAAAASDTSGKSGGQAAPAKIFSREPLDLSGLNSADVQIDVAIDTLLLGLTTMENVATKLDLQSGRLSLAPVKGRVAGSNTEMTVKLDAAASPARLSFNLNAPSLDLSQLFKMGGLESAISGKTDVHIALTSNGDSPHAFASHTNGTINLLMDAGNISSSQLSEIAGSLLQIFAPGVGSLTSTGIKCMAARYVITNGLMDTKGLLIDTDMTTISGKGYVNLPDERIGMSLYTRPKGLGLGGMIPPMQITGDLASPSFAMDAAGAVQKLTSLLTKSSTGNDGVPTLVTVQGKNTCAATLDNPSAATSPSPADTAPLIPSATGIKGKVEEIGNTLMKGILGKQ